MAQSTYSNTIMLFDPELKQLRKEIDTWHTENLIGQETREKCQELLRAQEPETEDGEFSWAVQRWRQQPEESTVNCHVIDPPQQQTDKMAIHKKELLKKILRELLTDRTRYFGAKDDLLARIIYMINTGPSTPKKIDNQNQTSSFKQLIMTELDSALNEERATHSSRWSNHPHDLMTVEALHCYVDEKSMPPTSFFGDPNSTQEDKDQYISNAVAASINHGSQHNQHEMPDISVFAIFLVINYIYFSILTHFFLKPHIEQNLSEKARVSTLYSTRQATSTIPTADSKGTIKASEVDTDEEDAPLLSPTPVFNTLNNRTDEETCPNQGPTH